MNKERRNQLKEEYKNHHPEMGIVCWKSGEKMWIAKSKDVAGDYNRTAFQLKYGSWPNREMQAAYNEDPNSFEWLLLKKLDYKELDDNHDEDLELLYMLCIDEFPKAKTMRLGRR